VTEATIVDRKDMSMWQTAQTKVGIRPPALSDMTCIAVEVNDYAGLWIAANEFCKGR